jgi:hypothetical protein
MARTIAQIQQSIVDAKNADATLAGITSSSRVAIWLLWTWVMATCMWTLEVLFDFHKAEVTGIIETLTPHTLPWYVAKAKLFQYGDTLPADSDVYSPVDETHRIVAFAAAVELPNLVRIKTAKVVGAVLGPLAGGELTAFTAYMNRIKDAGVRLQLTSGPADILQLGWTVYYDPLVLDATGVRLDGTGATPVLDEVNRFLDNLPFNGLFVLNNLMTDVVNNVEGVRIVKTNVGQAYYGATAPVSVNPEYIPDAGYMVLDTAYFTANVTYVAHGPVS